MIAVIVALVWSLAGRSSGLDADSPVSQLATAAAPVTASTSTSTPPVRVTTTGPAEVTTTRAIPVAAPPISSSTTTTPAVGSSTTVARAPGDANDPPLVIATPPSPDEVGAEALGLVQYDWRSRFEDWEIVFDGARDGLRALTFPGERRIEVFVRPSDSAASIHRVLAHEIGHMVDVEINSNADRDRWRRQRGLGDAVSWWPNESQPDFATGAGDFAEAFAVWETGVTSHSTVSRQPNAADLALLEELASEG